jgi:hypothetical protein
MDHVSREQDSVTWQRWAELTEQHGSPKGTAYVQFANLRSAEMALDTLNGYELAGRTSTCSCRHRSFDCASGNQLTKQSKSCPSLNAQVSRTTWMSARVVVMADLVWTRMAVWRSCRNSPGLRTRDPLRLIICLPGPLRE